MSEPERIHTSKLPDTFREVDGFGKPEAKPGPSSQRDPGTVRPVDLTPDAKAMKLVARERKRHESVTLPVSEPERALAKDATDQARHLKRDHRALYASDPRRFRKIVRGAQSKIFRQRPGPKPDRQAARRISRFWRAGGASLPGMRGAALPGSVPVVSSGQSCTSDSCPVEGAESCDPRQCRRTASGGK